ncbi:MAG: DoxX family protein [Dehalococcoidia bacterium]
MDWLFDPFGPGALDWTDHLEWALLPLRLVVGYVMFDSGRGKWARGISGTGEWFRGMGFPAPQALARFVATVELVGGTLLMLGLLTHLAALAIAGNMVVAAWTQKVKLHAPFQGGDVQGYELDVLLAAPAVTLAIGGGGPLSLDALFP